MSFWLTFQSSWKKRAGTLDCSAYESLIGKLPLPGSPYRKPAKLCPNEEGEVGELSSGPRVQVASKLKLPDELPRLNVLFR